MILIVDDTPANILALKGILELHNLKSDTAESGEEALKKILKHDYSLIIMDVQMPGMDGFEVAEILLGSSKSREIPIIFLSAVSKHKKFISRGYEAGGVDYITKPFDPDLLILRVKTFLKLSEQRRALNSMSELLLKEVEIRKQAQEDLEIKVEQRTLKLISKNEQLELRNHELQQFSWVVSHDLKEPVRKIQMFVRMISELRFHNNTKASDLIMRTTRAAERMQQLIDDLLDFSRLSSTVLLQPVDLNLIIKEILLDFDHIVREKDARLYIGDLAIVEGVPGQLRQVFQNLIGNALKFSKDGIPPVIAINCEYLTDKTVDAPVTPSGQYCRITIKDNGIGFDEKYLDKIFIIFQRLHDTSSFEGTGIGLAIVKKIIEKHNGLVTATSTVDEGSTFIIILPVYKTNLNVFA